MKASTQTPSLTGTAKGKLLTAAQSAILALAVAGLTGCDKKADGKTDGKADDKKGAASSAAKSGPERTEGKIEQAKLEEFGALLPAEVGEWKKKPRLGFYSSDTASTVTATYSKDAGGDSFSIVITFSNMIVGQSKGMLANPKQAGTFGFDIGTFAGYPALLGKAGTNTAGTPFTVVLSNSRSVQLMYNAKGTLTVDAIRPVFEKVDLKAIADK